MDYLEWNNRIAEKIFSPEKQDHPVLLTVTRDLVEEIGTFDDYLDACIKGPAWLTGSKRAKVSLFHRAFTVYDDWRARKNLNYPPYLAYLGLMVIAAAEQEATERYYDALSRVITPMVKGSYEYQHRLTEIWFDLETWSQEEKNGQLGLFEVFWIQDKWIHVGLINAQRLLSLGDVSKLVDQFYASDLDPSITPSSNELLNLAASAFPKLKDFINQPESANQELLEKILRMYFDKWDGQPTDDYTGLAKPRGTLLLSARVNTRRRSVRLGLRAKTTLFEFPRDGFKLSLNNSTWVARPLKLEISSLIEKQGAEGEAYQVTGDDLLEGLQLEERSGKPFIAFRLRPGSIRILTLGDREGIEGWIEDSHAPAGAPFYFLVHDTKKAAIWDHKEDFDELMEPSLNGIPGTWSLFHCRQVLTNSRLERIDTCFAEAPGKPTRLVGGIPARQGSRKFMYFGPPQVRLPSHAGHENVEVRVRWDNGEADLGPVNEQGIRKLPENLPSDKPLIIEKVDPGGQVEELIRFTLVRDESLELGRVGKDPHVDTFGKFLERGHGEGIRFTGGMVEGAELASNEFSVYREFDRAERVIFLGADPRQYSEWPERPIPKWKPVWLVCINGDAPGNRRVVFSGLSPEQCTPSAPDRRDSSHKKWAACLKEFGDPKFALGQDRERELWSRYVATASTSKVWSTGTSINTQLADELGKLKQ